MGLSQPDRAAPQVNRGCAVALSVLTCVRRIDSFGSVAIGRADQWSDLDLLVSCEQVERTAWLAAAVETRAGLRDAASTLTLHSHKDFIGFLARVDEFTEGMY